LFLEFLKVRDLPMLRELSVLQAIELKRLKADVMPVALMSPNSFTCVPETLFMPATRSPSAA
jgi:hypothetical protein